MNVDSWEDESFAELGEEGIGDLSCSSCDAHCKALFLHGRRPMT